LRAVLAAAAVAAVVGTGMTTPAMAGSLGPAAFGFGSNQAGELGDGSTTARYSPALVTGLPVPVRQVAAGAYSSAALLTDGTVWAWGSNQSGTLGNGTSTGSVSTAQQVPGLSGITQIAMGVVDVYAVRSDGTVWAWGYNQSGQLGNGTTTASYSPAQVPGLTGITQVSAGLGYVLARRSNGTVWAWGDNSRGFLGDGTTVAHHTPEQVPGLAGITRVTANYASFAVRSDGALFSWGANDDGALGNGTSGGFTATPARVPGLTGVTQVDSNNGATLAVAGPAGTVWAWGWNDIGQLGDGTTASRLTPEQLSLTGVSQVAVGISGGSAAVRSDGTLLTWGGNGFGNLGQGTVGGFTVTPAPVRSLARVSQVAFGGGYGAGYGLAVGFPAFATVPDLSGDTTAQAGQALQAANLVLGTVSTTVDNLCDNIGRVMSQNPAAGSTVSGGTAVSITIGQKPSHPCP
jgi:regulator of chromosome condensation (RCC1) repeat-containing protein/PASTA domain-containing protein/Regulator of Chromosome Condensation (RCC1) repeat protein